MAGKYADCLLERVLGWFWVFSEGSVLLHKSGEPSVLPQGPSLPQTSGSTPEVEEI